MTDVDGDLGDRGTTRGGSPVKVIVKLNGTAVAGVTVSAQATDVAAVSKTTGSDGVASFTLAAGQYKVSASSKAGTATKSVKVADSTSVEIVALNLQAKAS